MSEQLPNINSASNGADTVVEIRHLTKSFEQIDILKDLDLLVKRGENLVVLGKSGSGKSTLIKCIIGLVEPDQGEIKVFGEDISTRTRLRTLRGALPGELGRRALGVE